MDLRSERGAISGAEGCMFFAMLLFAVLLIGLLVVAFFRFREPPQNLPVGGPPPSSFHFPVSRYQSGWNLVTGSWKPAKAPHG